MRFWDNEICLDSTTDSLLKQLLLTFLYVESYIKSKMIICYESLSHLGKNEAKILVVSDSVLSVDQNWDFEKIRFA